MKKEYFQGQEVLGLTSLPRDPMLGQPKLYFWMKDGDGTIYLTKAKEKTGVSYAADGSQELVAQGYEPDFS